MNCPTRIEQRRTELCAILITQFFFIFSIFDKIKVQKTLAVNKYEYVQDETLDNPLLLLMRALVEDKGHGSIPA